MGGDGRNAVIEETKKRGMKTYLPPLVPFGSPAWPAKITPGPGPGSIVKSVLSAETSIVKKTICHASAVTASRFYFAKVKPNFSKTDRGVGPARYWANFLARSGCLEDFNTAMGYEIFGPSAAGISTATFTFLDIRESVL
jgi:hypothetical protein